MTSKATKGNSKTGNQAKVETPVEESATTKTFKWIVVVVGIYSCFLANSLLKEYL